MRRNHGILVGIRSLDLRRQREFRLQGLADRKQLPGEGGDGRFRKTFARRNVVGETDRLDLFLWLVGRAAESAGGNFRGLVDRMVLRDRLGGIDRQELRRSAIADRGRDRVRGDFAVDRTGGEINVGLLFANSVGGFVGRKLHDLDLVRIHAILLQDHLEQIDVGLGASDHADAAPGQLCDLRDLWTGLLAFAHCWGRNPQHRDVLAQRCHRLRIFRHIEIAADDGEIGLPFGKRLGALGGPLGLHRPQPDLAMGLAESLRQRLDDLDVIAAGRTDRDPQCHRPHRKIVAARQRADDSENPRQRDQHHLPLRRARRWRGQ